MTTPPRLWPGVLIAMFLWTVRLGAPLIVLSPFEELMVRGISGLLSCLVIVVWWLFFSRIERRTRWLAIGVFATAVIVTLLAGHPSIGAFWLFMYGLPVICSAVV